MIAAERCGAIAVGAAGTEPEPGPRDCGGTATAAEIEGSGPEPGARGGGGTSAGFRVTGAATAGAIEGSRAGALVGG